MRCDGCPRCILDVIRFTQPVELPRFSMEVGEEWTLSRNNWRPDGSVELGAGWAPPGTFEVVKMDDHRATGCRGPK